MKKQHYKFWIIGFDIFYSLGLLITTFYFVTRIIINRFNNTDTQSAIILTIALSILLIILMICQVMIAMILIKYHKYINQMFLLSLISLNIVASIYFFINRDFKFSQIKIRKLTILDISFMGFSLGLYLLFDFVTGFIQLPAFTSLSLKFLPLFFLAYSTDFIRTFIVALLGGILSWWMPSNWDIGMPVAYILDYMVPVLAISIATFIKPLKSDDKLFNWINWFIFLTIPTIIIYFSRVLAGYFFYGAEAWDGYGILVYSMVLNAINTTFDYLLFIIIVPPICTTLRYISTRLK